MMGKNSIGRKFFMMLFGCVILTLVSITVIAVIELKITSESSLTTLSENKYEDYDNMIAFEVESVVTMLDAVNKRIENGELTEKQGKDLAADIIRQAKYGEGGYFWADTTEGINVVLLGKENVEGKSRIGLTDKKGFKIVEEFLKIGNSSEGKGYLNYWFPKKGETEPSEKRAYVMLYKPFGWIIGTGNYIGDLEDEVSGQRSENKKFLIHAYLYIMGTGIIISLVCAAVTMLFSKKLQNQLSNLKNAMDKVSSYNLDTEKERVALSKYFNDKDEIGEMIRSIRSMVKNLKMMLKNITTHAQNTAATAEQLTATAQSTNESAKEVANAVENIAE